VIHRKDDYSTFSRVLPVRAGRGEWPFSRPSTASGYGRAQRRHDLSNFAVFRHHFRRTVENAFVESFNGKFRDECLNEYWFLKSGARDRDDRAVARRLQHRASTQRVRRRTPDQLRNS